MGASQSTGGATTPGGGDVKTSYYQLLEVERTATQDELKKAYRRKALELHPDRNHGDTERTTALFAEIQSAYEVLSDEQERAWYDAHERDILRGGSGEGTSEEHYQGSMKVTTADELVRMMGKFRGKVDFSDSPNGFFGYVRETFETLAKEEEYAADFEDIQLPEYPTFGHKDDQYDDVVKNFYAAWNGFATAKSFAWLDVYRLSDAPDRRTRRLAEKENQNYRDAGRREFNEAVRTLVAFVRRRDPRFTPNTQSDEARAKAQRDARKAQAQRARAAQMAKLDQEAQELPSWATARPADELEEESEEDIEEEHYECVACNKTFKSERQYEAHEKSKKHQKAIQTLKRKMQKDNKNLNLDGDGIDSGAITPADDDLESDGVDSEANGHDDAKQKHPSKSADLEAKDDGTDGEESSGSDYFKPAPGIPRSQKPPPPPESEGEEDDENTEDDEYASRSDIEARLAGLKVTNPPTSDTSTHDAPPTEPANLDKEDAQTPEPKMGKAAQKRAKKAARAAEESQSESTNKCLGCDAAFSSKTQLHQHLQEHPKHAALKSVGTGGSKKKKGKR